MIAGDKGPKSWHGPKHKAFYILLRRKGLRAVSGKAGRSHKKRPLKLSEVMLYNKPCM